MRKLLLIFASILFVTVGFASDLMPTYVDGRRWEFVRLFFDTVPDFKRYEIYEVKGDTLVDGATHKALNRLRPHADPVVLMSPPWFPFDPDEIKEINELTPFAVKEQDGAVFCSDLGNLLLFDIGMSVGDRLESDMTFTVKAVYNIELMGVTRRVLHVQYLTGFNDIIEDYWIEGIGPTRTDCTGYPFAIATMAGAHYGSALESVYDGDKKIFDIEEFNQKIKEATKIDVIEADNSSPVDAQLYNLDGTPVKRPVAGRIYVSRGKKILWTGR